MTRTSKAVYLPLSLATSAASGLVAAAVFKQIWKRIDDSDEPVPDPKDLSRPAAAALAGAAMQGLVFGLVRAAVERAGARGYRAVTNDSPL